MAKNKSGEVPEAQHILGCDIGGTFTDFVVLNKETGMFDAFKTLTTYDDPSSAIATGAEHLEKMCPGLGASNEYTIHGTTLVINAILERKGAATALITTKGFADIIDFRRENRYDVYDINCDYPEPLIEPKHRYELNERILASGEIHRPLSRSDIEQTLVKIENSGIRSVAVSLIHAYRNSSHEILVRDVAREKFQNLEITLSSDVLPEIREYERTSTTILNAYVVPLVRPYIESLQQRLNDCGYGGNVFYMLSGGGVISSETAVKYPVRLVESGPVGGILASAYVGERAGAGEIITFDVGGTTAKSTLIQGGKLPMTGSYEVDRVHRFKRGSGTPLAVPTVDMLEIGTGGGSIATINDMGLLQVGPKSAGSEPGPICYGRGGELPTVTDADVVLGYLNPEFFLGGEFDLDIEAAKAGIQRELADGMSLSMLEAAWGIREIADESMASAIRMFVTEKGGDLQQATIVAFGGAGPGHADSFARRLGVNRIIVPRAAGVFSALGFLLAPMSYEVLRSHVATFDDLTFEIMTSLFLELEDEARAIVAQAVSDAAISFVREMDVCYAGQGSSVRVSADGVSSIDDIRSTFSDRYQEVFGYTYDDLEIQSHNFRVTAIAEREELSVGLPFPVAQAKARTGHKGVRNAYSPGKGEMISHDVYDFDALTAGQIIDGPAIIEESSTAIVLSERSRASVDARGWIDIYLDGNMS